MIFIFAFLIFFGINLSYLKAVAETNRNVPLYCYSNNYNNNMMNFVRIPTAISFFMIFFDKIKLVFK